MTANYQNLKLTDVVSHHLMFFVTFLSICLVCSGALLRGTFCLSEFVNNYSLYLIHEYVYKIKYVY